MLLTSGVIADRGDPLQARGRRTPPRRAGTHAAFGGTEAAFAGGQLQPSVGAAH